MLRFDHYSNAATAEGDRRAALERIMSAVGVGIGDASGVPSEFGVDWAVLSGDDVRCLQGWSDPVEFLGRADPLKVAPEIMMFAFDVAVRVAVDHDEFQVSPGAVFMVDAQSRWKVLVAQRTDIQLVIASRDALVEYPDKFGMPYFVPDSLSPMFRTVMRALAPRWDGSRFRVVHGPTDLHGGDALPMPPAAVLAERAEEWKAAALRVFDQAMKAGLPAFPTGVSSSSRSGEAARFIRQHLTDPDLNVDVIASGLHLSRRSVQLMYENAGGVSTYIRRQRVALAVKLMRQHASDRPSLDHLAAVVGFRRGRTLERAFVSITGRTFSQVEASIDRPLVDQP